MKLVYVAGPFNGTIEDNIRAVELVALKLVELFPDVQPVVPPHSLSRVLAGVQIEERAYEGSLLLMTVCHGLLLTNRWHESEGARKAFEEALRRGMPVFEELYVFANLNKFRAWASGQLQFIFHHQQKIEQPLELAVSAIAELCLDLKSVIRLPPSWPLPGYHHHHQD